MILDRGIDPARKDARGHNAVLFASASDTVMPEVFVEERTGRRCQDSVRR
jgi:hypothetical protein